jgi:hydroxyacylglutathione hydrolase
MKFKRYILLPSFETNTYILWEEKSREAILIDPAAPSQEVCSFIKDNDMKLKYIVNTHGHGDHIGGNSFFKDNFPEAKLCIHELDSQMLLKADLNLSLYYEQVTVSPPADLLLENAMKTVLGEETIIIYHTPGHSKGGVVLKADNLLFSGDTLFHENVGRTDLPGGVFADLVKSIRSKLFVLPEDTIVLPGHGDETTIGHEKRYNPFVGD